MTEANVSSGIYSLIGMVMVIIFITGLVLNGSVILIFRTIYKETKGCTDLLILSISYCNLFHILTYPLNIISSFQRHWGFGNTVCQLDAFWVHSMANTSIAHLTMLSVDRYVSVSGRQVNKLTWYKYSVVAGCWVYGFLWSTLPLVGWSEYELEGIGISCSAKFGSVKIEDISYDIILFIFDFLLPLSIIALCHVGIYARIRKHNIIVFNTGDELTDNEAAKALERKMISLVITMVAAFTIAWTPYAVVCFLMMIDKDLVDPLAATLPAIIAKSSACYFPVIYGLKHTAVKRGFQRIVNLIRMNQIATSSGPVSSRGT